MDESMGGANEMREREERKAGATNVGDSYVIASGWLDERTPLFSSPSPPDGAFHSLSFIPLSAFLSTSFFPGKTFFSDLGSSGLLG